MARVMVTVEVYVEVINPRNEEPRAVASRFVTGAIREVTRHEQHDDDVRLSGLSVIDTRIDDPSICDYCGEPYNRCPCGAVDHWDTTTCPRCGPYPVEEKG
jgi:hypothetical protein